MKNILCFAMIFALTSVFNADAAMKIKNFNADAHAAASTAEDGSEVEDANDIATLENDIRILDEEIAKCKKQKKGWIAATVVGAAGVVATGTAAAVQGVKIGEKKDTLSSKQKELKNLKDEKKNVEGERDKFLSTKETK